MHPEASATIGAAYYRGYLIHFSGEAVSWRFMATPAVPELPILSRGVSQKFFSREEALAEAKVQINRVLGRL
jgi:hypothetical protein